MKEILGPRAGPHETLDQDPLEEYITGILAPTRKKIDPSDMERAADLPAGDSEEGEDEQPDADVQAPPRFSPTLDPKTLPSSMGLSFRLTCNTTPRLDVCVTWARYQRDRDGDKKVWKRQPRWAIIHGLDVSKKDEIFLDANGKQCDRSQAEVSLQIQRVEESGNTFSVSIFLVNSLSPPEDHRIPTEYHIFQPEIRIRCAEGCRPDPSIEAQRSPDPDLEELDLLYAGKEALARGHMCSAVWRELDPERPCEENLELMFPQSRHEPPFTWVDGVLIPQDQRRRFEDPDIRTTFTPLYSIPFPALDWDARYGPEPVLDPEKLSEAWEPGELREMLEPLAKGYEKWIDGLAAQLGRPDKHRATAERNIKRCRECLERIKKGIDLLLADDEARLAFLFANRAISLQYTWKSRRFSWHPYQLAFILMNIESIVNPSSQHRGTCDLLWVPTGAGKTEAYLGLVAFTLAYRRRAAMTGIRPNAGLGQGTAVISRYTLRLLTIQQFRRSLSLITACEFLRVQNLDSGMAGWRPVKCPKRDNFLWGSTPFRIGLWVGGNVRPNQLENTWGQGVVKGALELLQKEGKPEDGEPAQILKCPVCGALLAVPQKGLPPGDHTLYLVVKGFPTGAALPVQHKQSGVTISVETSTRHQAGDFATLHVRVTSGGMIKERDLDNLWKSLESTLRGQGVGVSLVAARASRPGYFLRSYIKSARDPKPYDFEIFCPNPHCDLHVPWQGGEPSGSLHGVRPQDAYTPDIRLPDGNRPVYVQEAFRAGDEFRADRIPVPALTVDEQLYRKLPEMIVATVDKFARMPFEPRVAQFFGNVERHHFIYGYYRKFLHGVDGEEEDPPHSRYPNSRVDVSSLHPPDLIIQDELHLIEGPLGSLVGLYETAVDYLCSEAGSSPKYIASTATFSRAADQVKAVFAKELSIFPSPCLKVDDRFFIRESEAHALDDRRPGRLYLGVCAPGKGPLTPIVRIWAKLLQTVGNLRASVSPRELDPFWTLVGYFNAIRELAGAVALYKQDIPQRVARIQPGSGRLLSQDRMVELSSRTSSTDLPSVLEELERPRLQAPDALLTTSMFGTGVDIQRLSLMVVNGQPKTTSAYIQATGRVGRSKGALVVSFYRSTRPRDLSHYEFFLGYHRSLHRFVEPSSVHPFSEGAVSLAAGPVAVAILRNMRGSTKRWSHPADTKMPNPSNLPEIKSILEHFERRAQSQPSQRRPHKDDVHKQLVSGFDNWHTLAQKYDIVFQEYRQPPKRNVVLGDSIHVRHGLVVVYENVPQSLREIEETVGFQDFGQ